MSLSKWRYLSLCSLLLALRLVDAYSLAAYGNEQRQGRDTERSSHSDTFPLAPARSLDRGDEVREVSLDLRDISDVSRRSKRSIDEKAKEKAKAGYDTTEKTADLHMDDFFNFKTRPDLQAPRWNLTVYEPDKIAPGYWFCAPYEVVFQRSPQPSWIGPHIYDNDGELVWSGTHLTERSDAFNFGIQEFQGEKRLVFAYRDELSAVVLDNSYNVINTAHIAPNIMVYNAHDLNMVDHGRHALSTFKHAGEATLEESRQVGFTDGPCSVAFDGFRVRDTNTPNWDIIWEWSSYGHIHLNESTQIGDGDINKVCQDRWDYVHLNSVDTCPDGDYLLSSRHTSTIYKISHKDGSILYRIGGIMSDFEGDFEFSAQHHIRCREQNETHLVMSMMDNARAHRWEEGTHEYSRGLVISLDLASRARPRPMHIDAEYRHPDLGFANSRGNLQYLNNGNAFLSWALTLLMSEHTSDGSVIMRANLRPSFLASYRAFKYEFVGQPSELPAVYAEQGFGNPRKGSRGKGKPVTRVYVSWNGATEVASWSINRTSSAGNHGKRIAKTARTGFETMIQYNDTINTGYLVVEAWDKNGELIPGGGSKVVRVNFPSDWDFDSSSSARTFSGMLASRDWTAFRDAFLAFVGGILATVLLKNGLMNVLRGAWRLGWTRAWWRGQSYQPIGGGRSQEIGSGGYEFDEEKD